MRAGLMLAAAVTTLAPAARAFSRDECVEVGAAVGETRCTRFGAMWARERTIPIFIGVGAFSSAVRPSFAATIRDERGAALASADASRLALGSLRAYGAEMRLGGYFAQHAYLGFSLGLALGSNDTRTVTENGHAISLRSGINMIDARIAPLIGVRAPLGRVSLRGELQLPFQLVSVSFAALAADGAESSGAGTRFAIGIEPRVALDYWLTPDTTLAAWTGANVLRPGDYTAGVTVSFHVRPFDGGYW